MNTSRYGNSTWDMVLRARADEREALDLLVELYQPVLLQRVRRHPKASLLGRFAEPEDAVAETWSRFFPAGLRSFQHRGRGSLRAFLLGILDNTLADMIRRQSRQKRGGLPAHAGPLACAGNEWGLALRHVPSDDPTPTSRARVDELMKLLRERLGPERWEIWRLAELEGLKSHEIADRVGGSASGIRTALQSARAVVHRALASAYEIER